MWTTVCFFSFVWLVYCARSIAYASSICSLLVYIQLDCIAIPMHRIIFICMLLFVWWLDQSQCTPYQSRQTRLVRVHSKAFASEASEIEMVAVVLAFERVQKSDLVPESLALLLTRFQVVFWASELEWIFIKDIWDQLLEKFPDPTSESHQKVYMYFISVTKSPSFLETAGRYFYDLLILLLILIWCKCNISRS